MDRYEIVLFVAGVVALLAAWLPPRLEKRPLSLPIVLIAVGAGAFTLAEALSSPISFEPGRDGYGLWYERAAELGVLVSLMGAGLKLDRAVGWRSWMTTWRLLAIGMPVTIAVIAASGLIAGLPLASALLIGAALAPTDPVLAADVQVGEPSTGAEADPWAEDEVRFSLTSEAGLNDGLAFPFVYAAMALSMHDFSGQALVGWFLGDVVLRIAVGLGAGYVSGWLLSKLMFSRRYGDDANLAATASGFVAVAATLAAYGAAELLHGYGFLAVFIAAVTIRSSERAHSYHRVLHEFADQVEQLLVVALLVLLGGALAGGLLDSLDVAGLAIALSAVFIARPLAGALALAGGRTLRLERRAIAFFGIRGIGSIYYVAYASNAVDIPHVERVWSIVAATILLSVVVHGIAATPVMSRLDRFSAAREARQRKRSLAISLVVPGVSSTTDTPDEHSS
ncbi:MAG: cation:proton antiporter [Acidimicrobiia bacterium]